MVLKGPAVKKLSREGGPLAVGKDLYLGKLQAHGNIPGDAIETGFQIGHREGEMIPFHALPLSIQKENYFLLAHTILSLALSPVWKTVCRKNYRK